MLKRRMIRLLEKLLIQKDDIHREHGSLLKYTQGYQKRLSIIRKLLVREKEMFEGRRKSVTASSALAVPKKSGLGKVRTSAIKKRGTLQPPLLLFLNVSCFQLHASAFSVGITDT